MHRETEGCSEWSVEFSWRTALARRPRRPSFRPGVRRGVEEAPKRTYTPPTARICFDEPQALVSRLERGAPRLLVFHIGLETSEMSALVDLNSFGQPEMSTYRQAELRALVSRAFRAALEKKNVRLMTYRELIAKTGLPKMKMPSEF